MAIDIRLINIVSPNEFTLSYKSGVTIGNLYNGFTRYPDTGTTYSGGTTGITISGVNFDYSQQYWIKIEDITNGSFIIENINTYSEDYFSGLTLNCVTPTPTPTPITPTPTPTITMTNTLTPTPTITPTITPTVTVTPTRTPAFTPSITPSPTSAPGETTYQEFLNICTNEYCYMTMEQFDLIEGLYNNPTGGTYFQIGSKYYGDTLDDHTKIYEYIGTYILYDTPSCIMTSATLTTDTCYRTLSWINTDGQTTGSPIPSSEQFWDFVLDQPLVDAEYIDVQMDFKLNNQAVNATHEWSFYDFSTTVYLTQVDQNNPLTRNLLHGELTGTINFQLTATNFARLGLRGEIQNYLTSTYGYVIAEITNIAITGGVDAVVSDDLYPSVYVTPSGIF